MTTNRSVGPVPAAERIELLNVMRGVALCGILAVNILVMGTVGSTQGRTFPAGWDADWIALICVRESGATSLERVMSALHPLRALGA